MVETFEFQTKIVIFEMRTLRTCMQCICSKCRDNFANLILLLLVISISMYIFKSKLTNLYMMAHSAGLNSHKTMHGMNHRYQILQQFHLVHGPVINCLRIQDALMMYRLSFEFLCVLARTKPAVWRLT